MGIFSKNNFDDFDTDALREMAADAREDSRHSRDRGDGGGHRQMRDEAAELEAEIARREGGR
jgi:hypothetical protein